MVRSGWLAAASQVRFGLEAGGRGRYRLDLRGASLVKTDLCNADLRAALTTEAALAKARIEGARRG